MEAGQDIKYSSVNSFSLSPSDRLRFDYRYLGPEKTTCNTQIIEIMGNVITNLQ
jgi:hypothetical protein